MAALRTMDLKEGKNEIRRVVRCAIRMRGQVGRGEERSDASEMDRDIFLEVEPSRTLLRRKFIGKHRPSESHTEAAHKTG